MSDEDTQRDVPVNDAVVTEYRSMTTDIAALATPIATAVAGPATVATAYWLKGRKPKDPPPSEPKE